MLEQFEGLLAERGAHLVFSSLPAQLPSGQDLEGYFHHLGIVRASKNVKIFRHARRRPGMDRKTAH